MARIGCLCCQIEVHYNDGNSFQCSVCKKMAHGECIKCSKPLLKGDTLFHYTCKECSSSKRDELTRPYLGWCHVVHLALYNLSVSGSGRKGFFRWKEDICSLIDKHWKNLMPERDKTLNWINTVAGILSVHSKKVFKSGQSIFGETGWWALQKIKPPSLNDNEAYKQHKIYNYKTQDTQYKPEKLKLYGRGKRQRKENKFHDEVDDAPKKAKYTNIKKQQNIKIEPEINKEIKQEEVIDHKEVPNVVEEAKIKVKTEPLDIDWNENIEAELSLFEKDISDDMMNSPAVMFDPINEVLASTVFNNSECASPATPDVIENHYVGTKTLKLEDNNTPYGVSASATPLVVDKTSENELTSLTAKEENEFLAFINSCENALESDASVRRLRRKLSLRKLKREKGMEVFNLDNVAARLIRNSLPKSWQFLVAEKSSCEVPLESNSSSNNSESNYINHPALKGVNILDKFVKYQPVKSREAKKSFIQLIGVCDSTTEPQSIISPYTSRVLKPYIRRDFDTKPLKLNLLNEICNRGGRFHMSWPIDYCYVQPSHIPAVNSLCSEFFWPGIDLTECLQYPEFSCVVLYKKLLIGCAFMVPDVNYNEAYISFILVHPDWRGAGIGTFMIYHLIQTCMGKDITLHVSPSNTSMLLYQKFGFKIEELILDFYDKYIPKDQKGSRHAYFLRLQR